MLLNRVNSHRRAVINESDNGKVAQSTIHEQLDYECENKGFKHRETSQLELDKSHYLEHEEQTAKEDLTLNCQLRRCYPSIPFYGVIESISIIIKPFTDIINSMRENTSNAQYSVGKQHNRCMSSSLCERESIEDLEKSIVLQHVLDKLAQRHGNVYYLHCVCESEENSHARKRAREVSKIVNNTISKNFINYAESRRMLSDKNLDVDNVNMNKILRSTNTNLNYDFNDNNANKLAHNMETTQMERVPENLLQDNLIYESLCPSFSLSYHEYVATMHESISKMMQLRMNVELFNRLNTRKETISLPLERWEENENHQWENIERNKKSKEEVSYCTHHTITWSISNHSRWKDIIALLAIENETLILFIYASSRTTQEYLNKQMMRITHTELCWIEQATLLEESRAVQMIDSNPVVVMWTLLTHLPLTNAKVQFKPEEKELLRYKSPSSSSSSSSSPSSISPFLPQGMKSKEEKREAPMTHQEWRNLNKKLMECEANNHEQENEELLSFVEQRNFANGFQNHDRIERDRNTIINHNLENKRTNDFILESDKLHSNFDVNSNYEAKVYEEDIANELLANHLEKIENVNFTLLSSLPLTFTSCCTPAFRFRHKQSLSLINGEKSEHCKSNVARNSTDNNYELEWKSIGSRALILPHFFAKLLEYLIEEIKLNDFEIQCNYKKSTISALSSTQEAVTVRSNILEFNSVETNRANARTNKFVSVIVPHAPLAHISPSSRSNNSTSLYEKITRLSSLTWLEFISEKQRALIKEEIIDNVADAGYEGTLNNSQIRQTECEFLLHKLQFHRNYYNDDIKDKNFLEKKQRTNTTHDNRDIDNLMTCLNNNEMESEEQAKNWKQLSQKKNKCNDIKGENDISNNLICTDNWGINFQFGIDIIRIIQENVDDDDAD